MKRILSVLIALLFVLTIFPGTGFAASKSYPFAVEIIYPENNIDQLGYYHVPGTSGTTITLQATLMNLTDKPIEVYAIPLNAYSSLNGIIYQSPDDIDLLTYAMADQSYGMVQYIKTLNVYNIAPYGVVTADIRVTVPDIDAGTLLGSIRFRVYNGTQEVHNQDAGGSTILIDEYLAIDTAIQIDLTATVQPSVSAGISRLTDKGLSIPVVNRAALITENVSGSYEIRDSNEATLLEGSFDLPKMAPVTIWNLFEPWDSAWNEGDYTLVMHLNVNGQVVDSVQPFTIGEAEVSQIIESQQNQAARDAEANPVNATASSKADVARNAILKGVIIGVPTVFISILLWLLIRKQKMKKLMQLRRLSEKRYVREI